jgi:uncharacterized membrane protein
VRAGVINDANAVAGSVPREGGGRQAAIWHDGGVDKLSTPAGATSQATFIDDSGQALGWTAVDGKSTDALWRDGTRIDAAALLPAGSGWTDVRRRALNDRGQIVGGAGSTASRTASC